MLRIVFIGVGGQAQCTENDVEYFLWNSRTTRERLWPNQFGNNMGSMLFPNGPVMILMHGWTHDINAFWYPIVANTYVNAGANVIALDWSSLAQLPFPIATSIARLDDLSIHISRFIIGLSNASGIPFSRFYIIGHSLGAHLAVLAGDNIQRISQLRIRRINGLDPAGLQFAYFPNRGRLRTHDAWVDTILTDVGPTGAGIPCSIGYVNFWPYGGIAIQPGCVYYLCSHHRACHYFKEGITSNAFVSRRCTTFVTFNSGL